jgi:predicted AlkP superfamily phosphohydrolase/phosphomutase
MSARTLASALFAALLLASGVVLLVLFLNPELTLRHDGAALVAWLLLPYLLPVAVVFRLVSFLAGLVMPARPHRPILPALPGFSLLSLLALLAVSALFWFNLWVFRHSIPVASLHRLAAASLVLSLSALVLVAVGLDALLFPRHGRRLAAPLVLAAVASSLLLPATLRPRARLESRPLSLGTNARQPLRRVILIGLDGLGPERLEREVAAGRLPALADMVRRGAHGPLATLRPADGAPIWTTVFTGRLPRMHGVKGLATYRLGSSATVFDILPQGIGVAALERSGLVTTAAVSSSSRRTRALWNVLNAFGIATGIVRFWGTHPPERVQGFMLSDQFHRQHADAGRTRQTLFPPDLAEEVRARAVDAADLDPSLVAEFVDLSVDVPGDRVPWRAALLDRALAPDLSYQRAGSVLRAAYDPPFFATYFYGLDVVGHAFTRFAEPEVFGNVRPEEARRYGSTCDRYAEYLSRMVGETARARRPGEVLLVVSGHGMQPMPVWRRLWSSLWGGEAPSGTHAGAPDGVLLALGDGIRAGATLERASVLDVAPTVLYLMGLPLARDLDGRVLTEILEEDFVRNHPATYIPSYESLAAAPVPAAAESDLPPLPDER